ncbi:hypothetical protein P389DRAFT_95753 [Cystobasidium minutum MCA 4210]|uniref:uncharacterized protein n=1 Tax=Cystobasidium minutum MCA 4210 TaxID=1397322 RepID=UPI0034CD487A|eukprot:jgi/Rhomi1/95753/CE95752_2168
MASTSPVPQQDGLPRAKLVILVSSLLVSGVCNSMLNKYQDMQVVDVNTGKKYEQPVFQTLTMFVGETLCLVAFQVVKYRVRMISKRRASKHKYAKIPTINTVDDSGVVLNTESSITLRTVADDESDEDEDDGVIQAEVHGDETEEGVHAVKAVVGPDELLPGETESPPKNGEKMVGFTQALMWLPAIFDICGTTLMNVGLLWVPVSVYQMLRGSLVLFVGLFSVLFLHRRLPLEQWLSLFVVMLGIAIVGLSNAISSSGAGSGGGAEGKEDVGKAVLGAALVLFAQIFTASQFVIEEKIMTRYSLAPLKAVGLEGVFGLATTSVGMPILFFLFGRTLANGSAHGSAHGNKGYFDIPNGFNETFSNPTIYITSIFIAFSIAFFNFAGLAVTKNISATARSLLDCCRTVGIWIVSLSLGWEQLEYLQIVGFALLVYGTLCFNEVIRLPSFRSNQASIHDKSPRKISSATQTPSNGYRDFDDAVDASAEGDNGIMPRKRGRLESTERSPLLARES